MKISLLLSILLVSMKAHAQEWHIESDEAGIKVLSRQEEGSSVVSFRGEGSIAFPIEQVYKVLVNPNDYHLWMPLVKGSRVLEERSAIDKIVYIHIGMPWPVRDRYFINFGQVIDLGSESKRIEIKSLEHIFRDENKVLGWTHHSYFQIKPGADRNSSSLIVELNQDPRGIIPKWMVNWVQSSWPRLFFKNLKSFLERPGTKTND
ncbi:MAG: hypothetical protein NTX25_04025 [Proteobacteria bacterium]|nr:hypothetical protein [Pseudomonadota bacterium]